LVVSRGSRPRASFAGLVEEVQRHRSGVEVTRRYEFHCRAARELAQEFFDARKVLALLVSQALL
jgi:hypothetical protein